jgi:DNA-directed RNA polymerase specialized sigma24 family protein
MQIEGCLMTRTNTGEDSQMELERDAALFDERFWRCYRLQHVIAYRILDDPEQARKAVENCWHSASARAPHFEYEGAFRSWLLRVLIDEALLLLHERRESLEPNVAVQADGPGRNGMSVAESNA